VDGGAAIRYSRRPTCGHGIGAGPARGVERGVRLSAIPKDLIPSRGYLLLFNRPPLFPIRHSRQLSCTCHLNQLHSQYQMTCAAGGNCPIDTPEEAKSRPSRMHMPMWLRFLVDACFT
jgi:hypothetical protein